MRGVRHHSWTLPSVRASTSNAAPEILGRHCAPHTEHGRQEAEVCVLKALQHHGGEGSIPVEQEPSERAHAFEGKIV